MELNILSMNPKVLGLEEELWDAVIIGGGPASYNAALYMKRKGLKPLLIIGERGGQLPSTHEIENYLGFESISGAQLAENFHKHSEKFSTDIHEGDFVIDINKGKQNFNVTLSSGRVLEAKTVIYAAGGAHRSLGVEGEARLNGKGVSYCAICDGPFFKGKDVIVVGGGDSAVEAAIDLAKWAKHVHIVHRSVFRAEQILLDRMMALDNVSYELGSVIEEIRGEELVTGVLIYNAKQDLKTERKTDGIFIEIGQDPRVDIVKDKLLLNDRQEIIVDKQQRTNVPGFYACGDVTDTPFKQIVIAASEGAIAGLSASQYILKMEEKQ